MKHELEIVPSEWRLVEIRPDAGESVVVPPSLGARASFSYSTDEEIEAALPPDWDESRRGRAHEEAERYWFEWTDGVSSYSSRYVIEGSTLAIKSCLCAPNVPVDPDPDQTRIAGLMSAVLRPSRADDSPIEMQVDGDDLRMTRGGHTLVLHRDTDPRG